MMVTGGPKVLRTQENIIFLVPTSYKLFSALASFAKENPRSSSPDSPIVAQLATEKCMQRGRVCGDQLLTHVRSHRAMESMRNVGGITASNKSMRCEKVPRSISQRRENVGAASNKLMRNGGAKWSQRGGQWVRVEMSQRARNTRYQSNSIYCLSCFDPPGSNPVDVPDCYREGKMND